MLKIILSPSFETYIPLNDLEQQLALVNLSHLMPTRNGNRAAVMREMDNLSEEYGVKFKMVKESRRDIMWSVKLGRKNLGTYMLVYHIIKGNPRPHFEGSKPRIVEKAASMEDKALFADIVSRLNEALRNPGIFFYNFHRAVREWMKVTAAVVERRETGNGVVKEKMNSHIFYFENSYLTQMKALEEIYSKYGGKLNLEVIDD